MIELSPTTAMTVYLFITLCLILGIWFYNHYHSRNKTIISSEKKLFVCEYCQFPYLDEAAKPVTRCPQCRLYNKQAE